MWTKDDIEERLVAAAFCIEDHALFNAKRCNYEQAKNDIYAAQDCLQHALDAIAEITLLNPKETP